MSFNSAAPVILESVSQTTATPSVELGTRVNVAGKEYVYVYNACNSNALKGMGLVLDSGCTNYSCTISSVTSADLLIGVVQHATISTGYYGWALTRGFGTIKMGATSGTVLTLGLAELGANGLFVPMSNTTGNKGNAVAKAVDTIASSAEGTAYIVAI